MGIWGYIILNSTGFHHIYLLVVSNMSMFNPENGMMIPNDEHTKHISLVGSLVSWLDPNLNCSGFGRRSSDVHHLSGGHI